MKKGYTDERNIQMLIYLMKVHGIRKVVASPGTTNITFIASIQQDPFFEIYSSVDERSAAYIACGLAEETGESVALSCTGATASRNYVSGLTEAYYRKIPILAITSTQHTARIGQNIAQVIDRTVQMNDICKLSVQIPSIHDREDEWGYGVMLNKAILELRHRGCGPVHINLTTEYSKNYSVSKIPEVKVIRRIEADDEYPEITEKRVGIYVGAHSKWPDKLTEVVDRFCEIYNGVVFCDQTSNYGGKYRIFPSLVCSQKMYNSPCKEMDILIHIGNVSGADMSMHPKQVWRVNPDGEIRDAFRKLTYVFEMSEQSFFEYYNDGGNVKETEYYEEWHKEYKEIQSCIPELPFSNIWIAQHSAQHLPNECVLHLGILNSLRSWNFFETAKSVLGYSNTGGFGIDGCVSSLIGASLGDRSKLCFGIVGDLAFFYDMNSIGNRHVGNNIRLMVINNGCGTEFRNYNHPAASFGDDANEYIAAAGHYGRRSEKLVKDYAETLGFEYITAGSKEEYLKEYSYFFADKEYAKPVLFEVFTDSANESNALKMLHEIVVDTSGAAKKLAKSVLGDTGMNKLKKFIKR